MEQQNKKPLKRESSAGGIVFKGDRVLLVKNYIPDKDVNYWGFPKGHIEKGESGPQAALREVGEETGVVAQISQKIGDVKYIFYWEGEKIFKNVAMFLMDYQSGELKHQEKELAEAKWFSAEEALKIISFKNDREMLKKALELSFSVDK